MIRFYYNFGPNPMKVALFLEEAGLPYEAHPIDMFKGDQHQVDFRAINPNRKAPAIIDDGVTVFDSNAILLYLAEKTGRFMPPDSPAGRAELLSWLMFVATGIGPYSGQAVHFRHHAPERLPYAHNRYQREVERHYKILDERLAGQEYLLGATYTIVDMALWGWAQMVTRVLDSGTETMPNVKRLIDEISERPAAKAAYALVGRYAFKTDMDDDARKHMFPQNVATRG